MVQAKEKSVTGILEALGAGRYYATQGPAFHQVEITGRMVRVKLLTGGEHCILQQCALDTQPKPGGTRAHRSHL